MKYRNIPFLSRNKGQTKKAQMKTFKVGVLLYCLCGVWLWGCLDVLGPLGTYHDPIDFGMQRGRE